MSQAAKKVAPPKMLKVPDALQFKETLLLKGADQETLQYLSDQFEEGKYAQGDPVFLENEMSSHVYFVKSGSVEIVNYKTKLRQINRIKIFKSGTHFSEFSVLTQSPHSTSAFAYEDSVLYRVDRGTFISFLRRFPKVSANVAVALAGINRQISKTFNHIEYFREASFRYNSEMPKIISSEFIKRHKVIPLFYEFKNLAVAMRDPYNQPFFEAFKLANKEIKLNISSINENDFDRMEAKVLKLYSKGSVSFTEEKKEEDNEIVSDVFDLFKKSPLFSSLPQQVLIQLKTIFQKREYKAGQIIYNIGDSSEYFYLIQKGEVDFTKALDKAEGDIHIVTLGSCDGFSEISLLTGEKHGLVARALKNSVILCLHKKHFLKLLTTPDFSIPLAQVLAKRLQSINRTTKVKYFTDYDSVQVLELGDLLPVQIMEQQKVIPLKLENNELTIGIVDSENEMIFSTVSRYLSNYRINMQLIIETEFENLLSKIKSDVELRARERKQESERNGEEKRDILFSNNEEDAIELLGKILETGYGARASDIHMEPKDGGMCIRYRIDGLLQELHEEISTESSKRLVNRIKIMSKLDISERRFPQDGQLKIQVSGEPQLSRVSTVPSKFGEKIVLRLLRTKDSLIPLNMLAPDKRTIAVLKGLIKSTQGVFLITGPTGSGKTTTVYSILNDINTVNTNIVTIEDPVEFEVPGLTQIEVNHAIKLGFNRILKHVLRQDPDVIMVGEVRDEDSARMVMEGALTGHLVLATLHTNSSLDVVPRLHELGATPATLAAALSGVLAQRLLRALCTSCKVPRNTTSIERAKLARTLELSVAPTQIMENVGCERCNGTGYRDRIPVFEVWRKTKQMQDVILQNLGYHAMLQAAKMDGFLSLEQFGLKMVVNGLTTFEEVDRCLYGIMPAD